MDSVKFVLAVFSFHLLKTQIGHCEIVAPKSPLYASVGNDVYFRWNSTTKDIVEVFWGLYKSDSNSVFPKFMTTDIYDGNVFNYGYLNGSRYEGRVEYVGDIKNGQAWFLLKNVSSDDAVVYAAKITEGPALSPTFHAVSLVKLDVQAPATTVSPTTITTSERPSITKAPLSKKYTTNDKDTLKCTAKGNPEPSIIWEIKKTSREPQPKPPNSSQLIITPKEDAGEYTCIATNSEGFDSSVPAILQYTECDSGCSSFTIRFKMPDLVFTSDYSNQDSEEYKNLTKTIEIYCLHVYINSSTQIYSCVVQGFSRGSIVAELRVTHPENVENPKKPLEDAIKSGKFAGHDVTLVTGSQNGSYGGLPDWAIAVISVAVILVVAGIVAFIIWRVKKSKNNGNGSNNKSGPLEMDKPAGDGNPTSPEA